MIDWQASFSILTKAGVAVYILRGVAFSLVISVCAVVVSLIIGSVLALHAQLLLRPHPRLQVDRHRLH